MCFIFDWEKIVLVRPISESIKYLQRVRMKSVKLEILEMIFFLAIRILFVIAGFHCFYGKLYTLASSKLN